MLQNLFFGFLSTPQSISEIIFLVYYRRRKRLQICFFLVSYQRRKRVQYYIFLVSYQRCKVVQNNFYLVFYQRRKMLQKYFCVFLINDSNCFRNFFFPNYAAKYFRITFFDLLSTPLTTAELFLIFVFLSTPKIYS